MLILIDKQLALRQTPLIICRSVSLNHPTTTRLNLKTPVELHQSITGFSCHACCSHLSISAVLTGRSSAAHRPCTPSATCESTRAGESWWSSKSLITNNSLKTNQTLQTLWSNSAGSAGATDQPRGSCCSYRPCISRITYTRKTLYVQILTLLYTSLFTNIHDSRNKKNSNNNNSKKERKKPYYCTRD